MTLHADELQRTDASALEQLAEGVRFALTLRPVMNHHMWLIADYLGRRFGVPGLETDVDTYVRLVDHSGASPDEDVESRLLTRLLDPSRTATPEEIARAGSEQPVMLCRALYSDLHPDAEGLAETIRARGEMRGYARTHAALALRWVEELGAEIHDHEELRTRLLTGMADELHTDPLPPGRSSDFDLFCEQVAFMAYLGGPEQLEPAWVDHILSSQDVDGGWGLHHTTMLALWALLEGLVADPLPVGWIQPR